MNQALRDIEGIIRIVLHLPVHFRILHRRPDEPQKLNPEVPRSLQDTCLKCLEKHPDARYASLQALAADLERGGESHEQDRTAQPAGHR